MSGILQTVWDNHTDYYLEWKAQLEVPPALLGKLAYLPPIMRSREAKLSAIRSASNG